MSKQRQVTKMEIQTLQSQFEAAQRQLSENETHSQVINNNKKKTIILYSYFSFD